MIGAWWLLVALQAAGPVPGEVEWPRYEDEIVVTASLAREVRREVSASVDRVTAEQIDARLAADLAEVLTMLPGIGVVRSGPPGQTTSVFIRGTGANQTLVLWNGVRLDDPFFGGFDWAFEPVEGVGRVEVVRGSMSALYGSAAVGGVIQILTSPRDGGRLRLEVGDDDYRRGSLVAGHSAGASHFDLTALARSGESEFQNGFYDGAQVGVRVEHALSDGVNIGLIGRLRDADTGIPFAGGQPSLDRRIGSREWLLAMPLSAQRGRWAIEAQLSRVAATLRYRDFRDAAGYTEDDTETSAQRARSVVTYDRGGRLRLAFGGEIERVEVDNRTSFGVAVDDARQSNRALFGQLGADWRGLRLEAGLRRDDSDAFGDHWVPRLGAVVPLGERSRLRLGFAGGFRSPSLGELHYPLAGNPDLQPETSRSHELALDHASGPWQLSIAAFEIRQRQLIEFEFASYRFVNVGRTRSRGAELSLSYDRAGVSSRLTLDHVDARDLVTGRALPRRAAWSGSWNLTLRPRDWTLNVLARQVGDRPDLDPVTFQRITNPGYLVVDLAARRSITPRLALHLRVDNASDRRYQQAAGFPAPGRAVAGGLEVGF